MELKQNYKSLVNMEFKSITEFVKYLDSHKANATFQGAEETLKTDKYNAEFSKTSSYQEAKDMLIHGWPDMAKRITDTLQAQKNITATKTTRRSFYDVAGFQASVPRYLQGIPTNMIQQKQVVQKQKVITIVKHVGYLGDVTADEIIKNSVKALQIVQMIEAQGIRVNLDVISPATTDFGMGKEAIVCRVRVKSSSEKLNISKLAFPMVHPSMLRRMIFRFREVNPDVKSFSWRHSYGRSIYSRDVVKGFLNKGEYYLHNFIGNVEEEIKNMNLF